MPHPAAFSFRASASSPRAFTLIELLTVIAIIGILAAIIIPVVGRVRASARSTKCASNIRQIAQASILYANDNKSTLPAGYDASNAVTGWWWAIYADYVTTPEIFSCPDDQTTRGGGDTFTRNGKTLTNGKVSYGSPGQARANKVLGKQLNRFNAPTITVMFMEFQQNSMQLAQNWNADKPYWVSAASKSPESSGHAAFPHSDGSKSNLAFLDGHVAAMTAPDIAVARDAGRIFIGTQAPY